MKPFITLFFLLVITSCVAQKTNDTMLNIHYEARTRGSSKELKILGNKLEYVFNQQKKSIILTSENQKDIINELDTIVLDEMNSFESPSSKRSGDRALHATLKIKKQGKEYVSATFDDGNPPTELKLLVDMLMRFIEK